MLSLGNIHQFRRQTAFRNVPSNTVVAFAYHYSQEESHYLKNIQTQTTQKTIFLQPQSFFFSQALIKPHLPERFNVPTNLVLSLSDSNDNFNDSDIRDNFLREK